MIDKIKNTQIAWYKYLQPHVFQIQKLRGETTVVQESFFEWFFFLSGSVLPQRCKQTDPRLDRVCFLWTLRDEPNVARRINMERNVASLVLTC